MALVAVRNWVCVLDFQFPHVIHRKSVAIVLLMELGRIELLLSGGWLLMRLLRLLRLLQKVPHNRVSAESIH